MFGSSFNLAAAPGSCRFTIVRGTAGRVGELRSEARRQDRRSRPRAGWSGNPRSGHGAADLPVPRTEAPGLGKAAALLGRALVKSRLLRAPAWSTSAPSDSRQWTSTSRTRHPARRARVRDARVGQSRRPGVRHAGTLRLDREPSRHVTLGAARAPAPFRLWRPAGAHPRSYLGAWGSAGSAPSAGFFTSGAGVEYEE